MPVSSVAPTPRAPERAPAEAPTPGGPRRRRAASAPREPAAAPGDGSGEPVDWIHAWGAADPDGPFRFLQEWDGDGPTGVCRVSLACRERTATFLLDRAGLLRLVTALANGRRFVGQRWVVIPAASYDEVRVRPVDGGEADQFTLPWRLLREMRAEPYGPVGAGLAGRQPQRFRRSRARR